MKDEFKKISVECSEIPVAVLEGVRKYCQRIGFIADEETIISMARDEYDRKYLQEDGTYAPETKLWRKMARQEGIDPEEWLRDFFAHCDKSLEEMKRNDPAGYAEFLKEDQRSRSELQKLTEARKLRFKELNNIK